MKEKRPLICNFHIGEKGRKKDFWKTESQRKIEGVNLYPKLPQLHKTNIHNDLAAPKPWRSVNPGIYSANSASPHLWHEGKQINLAAYEATKQVKKSYIIFIIKYS